MEKTTVEALSMVIEGMNDLLEKIKKLPETQQILAFAIYVELCRTCVKTYDEKKSN